MAPQAIFFAYHFNFTFVSEAYDFMELYCDLWSFTRDPLPFSIISQIKVIILVNRKFYFVSIDYGLITFFQNQKD